jgi:hypothetical protein
LTEPFRNSLDCDFLKSIAVDYFFEENQILEFKVYDADSKDPDLSKHDSLGNGQCSLGDLVSSSGQTLTLPISLNGKLLKESHIIVKCEEISSNRDVIKMSLRAEKVDKKDFWGKSDPFLVFQRIREDGSWVSVFQTEVQMNTLNPVWKPISVPLQVLCNGDPCRPLRIVCYDWDKSSPPSLIGFCQTSIREMLANPSFSDDLIHPNLQKKKKSYRNSGKLVLQSIQLEENASFLSFVQGGCALRLMIAIDFTGSNGDPSCPGTLHYRHGLTPNQYQEAIRAIGNILAPYDSDQMFPVWGFGGKIKGEISHCFSLSMKEDDPEVKGVAGIEEVYGNAFKHVTLSGPTLFTQIIGTAIACSSLPLTQSSQHYSVLLIITDGVINDMDSTIST